ncbi:MAG: hypothetical protein D6820_16115 [Lentisphaerae bacterium]|nr:MAG: hypothetical protein D6820_16115 [Lentisphaerota bacterium]
MKPKLPLIYYHNSTKTILLPQIVPLCFPDDMPTTCRRQIRINSLKINTFYGTHLPTWNARWHHFTLTQNDRISNKTHGLQPSSDEGHPSQEIQGRILNSRRNRQVIMRLTLSIMSFQRRAVDT